MDQEEAAEAEAASGNTRKTPLKNLMVSKVFTTNSNKESPVWINHSELFILANQCGGDR